MNPPNDFFMSIDFGTSNCVAGITDQAGKPALVELEGDSLALPTAIYVLRHRQNRRNIDESEVSRRLLVEQRNDRERQERERSQALEDFARFVNANRPRAEDFAPQHATNKDRNPAFAEALKDFEEILHTPPPKKSDFSGKEDFNRAFALWETQSIGPEPSKENDDNAGNRAIVHRTWTSSNKAKTAAFESRYRTAVGAQSPAFKLAMVRFKTKSDELKQKLRANIRSLTSDEEMTRQIRRAMSQERESAAESSYWNQTLFEALQNNAEVFFGRAALSENSLDATAGFFVKSPKSFLGSDLGRANREFFLVVLRTIITRIKELSDKKAGKSHTGVVIGRPVTFNTLNGKRGDKQALELLTEAAFLAGFTKVLFFQEPVAAALTFPESLSAKHQPLLVVDVGGGTTDCVVLKSDSAQANRIEILSVSGARVGGSDFDQDVAWQFLMPFVGKDSLLLNGRPVPTTLFWNAISTRDVNLQRAFVNSAHEIQSLRENAKDPNLIDRFLAMHRDQSQHELIRIAEYIKAGFSKHSSLSLKLDAIAYGLKSRFHQRDYQMRIQRQISLVTEVVKTAINGSPIQPRQLFLTGGMSASPDVTAAVESLSGLRSATSGANRLLEVGTGLAIVATALNTEFSDAITQYERLGLEPGVSGG